MGIMDRLMNVGAVKTKGQSIESLGQELINLMNEFDKTTENILSNGLRGKIQLSLNNAHGQVEPEMSKQAQRVLSTGSAVKKSAVATETMDSDVASKLRVNK